MRRPLSREHADLDVRHEEERYSIKSWGYCIFPGDCGGMDKYAPIEDVHLRRSLESRILYGLAAEWRQARLELLPRQRGGLATPRFRLHEGRTPLGSWNEERNEISLSGPFVLSRGWDSIRDLLRHEMAHQLAVQSLGASLESPHGKAFQRACRFLGANPVSRGSYLPLRDRLEEKTPCEHDRLLRKVEKLQALAASANRHEAKLAMLRARELADRAHVESLGKRGRAFVSVFLGRAALRHRREEHFLAALVSEFYPVYGIWVPAFVLERDRMGRVFEISGAPMQVKMAEYSYEFISRHIAAEWDRFRRDAPLGIRRRTDFACGLIEGFRRTLTEGAGGGKSARRIEALQPVESLDPQLRQYLKERYPRRRTTRRGAATRHRETWNAGRRAGEKLVIHPPLEESSRRRGKLLA